MTSILTGPGQVPHSIVGVVGDVRRDMDGHHYAEVRIDQSSLSCRGDKLIQQHSDLFSFWHQPRGIGDNSEVFEFHKIYFSKNVFSHGLETKPKKFDLKKDRYQVSLSCVLKND